MIKSGFTIFSILVFSILSGCGREIETGDSLITTIPFSEAKEFKMSDFVAGQRYVLLSTEEEALFQRVDKLIAKNDQFYLFDHLGNSGVLVFDADGNFILKIGEFGEGPQQLRSIADFQVTEKGEIQILDSVKKAIVIYSSDGVWKSKIDLPVNTGGFAQLGDKWLLAINFDHQNEALIKNEVLGLFGENMAIDSLYFQYPEGAVNANIYYHAGLLSRFKNGAVFHRPPNDTISVFSTDGTLTDRLVIDFGQNRLPEEAVFDFEKVREYKKQDASFQYLQMPALPVGNYIFGTATSTKNEIWGYILELDSQELHSFKVDLDKLHLKDLILPSANLEDQEVVSLIDPMTFSQDANPDDYPEEVHAHLESEGSVLLIHRLKQ